MRKVTAIILAIALLFSLGACSNGANNEVVGDKEEPAKEVVNDKIEGKIAIITNTVSAREEEYRSAEQMVDKYGEDKVVHVTWPENAVKEQEQMITVLTKLGYDKDIKVIVLNQAMPGSNAAIDKLREIRDDILVISCNFSENPPDVAKKADVGILGDNFRVGEIVPVQAQKMGAKTLVYYSFPRHLSLSIFSVNRDKMKEGCAKLGIEFVEVTAPDPTGDAGISGTQQFILEDVPKKIEKYGKDTALYATNCVMQIPLIEKIVELKAIYVIPCCPSPFHGFPVALGLNVPEDKKGDVQFVIDATSKVIKEAGVSGRISNFPVPGAYMLSVAGVEYGLKWMAGETNGKFDKEVLEEVMNNYAGSELKYRLMEDAGITYDNVLLYLQNFIEY